MNQDEAILRAMRALGGDATIREVGEWVTANVQQKWASFGTPMADLTAGGNASSHYPPERQFLERVEEGRYRLLPGWLDSEPGADGVYASRATISLLTDRNAVLRAIEEFDLLERDAFLERYGFGHAKTWFVSFNGKVYDSNAIVGVALGFQHNQVFTSTSFAGGEHSVVRQLRKLGFMVAPVDAINSVALPEEVEEEFRERLGTPALVNRHERNPKARAKCLAIHGTRCSICEIDFGVVYGEEFAGLIHVHHRFPRAQATETVTVDPQTDLVPVCPNCHAVIHHRNGLRTPTEVQQCLEARYRDALEAESCAGAGIQPEAQEDAQPVPQSSDLDDAGD